MPRFRHEGQRLAYSEHGTGERAIVLIPGLLFSQKMHVPLAKALARRGNRVITLDPLGHGASDRPRDMWRYSMTAFGEQVVALLDALEVEQAVVGGTSLGANVTLEVADLAPERLRGMVLEMPVLDNALPGIGLFLAPLLLATTFGAPVLRGVAWTGRRVPRRGLPLLAEVMLDWISQDPRPSAAVLQGLAFGRIAPNRARRRTFAAPALVIGHSRDPLHPFSDSDTLVRELPDARLVQANSFFEMRFAPERITEQIADFVDSCWKARGAQPRQRRAAGGTRRRAAG